MKIRYHFARQRRQLRHLAKIIARRHLAGQALSEQLLARFRRLVKRLLPKFGQRRLQHSLGTASFVLGLGVTATAQAPSFQAPVTNPFGFDASPLTDAFYNFPAFADLDNDGDLDLMTAFSMYDYDTESYSTSFIYYENVGSAEAPAFAAPQNDPFNIPTFNSDIGPLELVDVDADGDLDIVATGFNYEMGFNGEGVVFLIENEGDAGTPAFGDLQINGLALPTPGIVDNSLFVNFGDLDGDGDLDVLGNAYDEDGIDGFVNFYYENTATDGSIAPGEPEINPFGIANGGAITNSVVFSDLADLDNDGDLDLLTGQVDYDFGIGYSNSSIAFHENTGTAILPSFEQPVVNPFGITLPTDELDEYPRLSATDIDADGDLDLMVITSIGLLFLENDGPSSVAQHDPNLQISLAPNPTTGIVQLSGTALAAQIEISTVLGRRITTMTNSPQRIDLSAQPKGTYLVKVITEDQRFRVFRLQKQ